MTQQQQQLGVKLAVEMASGTAAAYQMRSQPAVLQNQIQSLRCLVEMRQDEGTSGLGPTPSSFSLNSPITTNRP
jgi:hypothetical protein